MAQQPGVQQTRTLEGEVAIVTGAGRGIGRAIAVRLAAAGATVVCASRTASELDVTVQRIVSEGGQALAVPTDVSDQSSVAALTETTVGNYGRLTLAVLNAGVSPAHQPLAELTLETWSQCIAVNLTGVFIGLRAAVPHMRAGGGGRIIAVGSGASRRAPEGLGAYAAAKAGMSTLLRAAARELRSDNIAVNELQPGPTATGLHGFSEDEPPADDEPRVLGQGLGDDRSIGGEWLKAPRDVAEAALFLASLPPYGPTGQTLSLNSVI